MAADDTLVNKALNRVELGEKAHQDRTREYDRAYDVYRATAKARQPRGRNKETWESDIRIPYGMQVTDTAMVNLIGGKPRAKVQPRRPDNASASKSMQTLIDYHVAEDHLAEKQVPITQQALIYGITAAKVHWLYRERANKPVRYFEKDPLTGDYLRERDSGDYIQRVTHETVVQRDGPTIEPWDVYQMWWEPNARDVDTAAYVVFQSYVSADDLRAAERTDAQPWGIYRNVDECLQASAPMPNQSAQERFIGGGYNKHKDRHELLEIWTADEVMVIGNRNVVMRYEDNPYDHGRKPAVIASVRPDMFEIRGMSETELLDHIQQAMWTMMNMRFDNLHMTVQRGMTYREAGVIDPQSLQLKPRFKWGVTDHDDIRMVDMPTLPPEAYREDDVLLSRMQLVTGINPYVSGADLNTVDQNTATGVTALQEVASRLLKFKARQLAYGIYQRSFEMWVDLIKQYTTSTQAIRIEGPDGGYDWEHIEPWEIAGNFDVSVEGTEESLSRQQERAEAMGLLNAIGPLLNAVPGIQFGPVARKLESSFDMADGALYQPPPQQQPAPPAAPTPPPLNGGDPAGAMAGAGAQPALPGPSLYGPEGAQQ